MMDCSALTDHSTHGTRTLRAKASVTARVAPKQRRALLRFEQAAALGHVEAMVRWKTALGEGLG